MKLIPLLTTVILLVMGLTMNVRAQDNELPAYVKVNPSSPISLVESGKFRFVAERAFPTGGGGGVNMSSRPNTVEVNGDRAIGNLAYFGTNASAAYNNDSGGIEFDVEIPGKKLKKKEKKNQITLSFSAQGNRDTYNCIFTITEKGPSNLNVSSNRKTPISYRGYIYPLAD